MRKLINNGEIVEDNWLPVDPESSSVASNQIHSLAQWLALADKSEYAVQLEPGEAPAELLDSLDLIPMIAIHFPVFTDGRGFSYARELRQRGYKGELRAVGHILRDQLHYLHRCGFDAFQFNNDEQLEEALPGLADFSIHYQASIDEPLPLFRRRG